MLNLYTGRRIFFPFLPMRLSRTLMSGALSAAIAFSAAVPALAVEAPRDRASGQASGKREAMTQVDGTCMATAATTRDTAIAAELQKVVTAIQKRGTDLAAAWAKTDAKERRTAIKAANEAFKGTWKTFNASRKAAWEAYRKAAKACKATGEDVGSPEATSGM